MKRLSLILLLLVLSIGGLSAQTVGKVVSGTIIAGDDNSPIAGATIRAKNTKGKGTVSDVNGKFRLLLPDNEDAVIVSFIGYASREITAGKELRIVLKPEAEALKEVMVVAHSDCGACHMNSNEMIEHMKARGIKQETIDMIRFCGVDFGAWLDGFEDTEKSVKGTVRAIMEHPLIPEDIMVRGFIIDSVTGELTKV